MCVIELRSWLHTVHQDSGLTFGYIITIFGHIMHIHLKRKLLDFESLKLLVKVEKCKVSLPSMKKSFCMPLI